MNLYAPLIDAITWASRGYPPEAADAEAVPDPGPALDPTPREAPSRAPKPAARPPDPSPLDTPSRAPEPAARPPEPAPAAESNVPVRSERASPVVGGGLVAVAGSGACLLTALAAWAAMSWPGVGLGVVVAFVVAGGVMGWVGRMLLVRLHIPCRAPWCELVGGLLSGIVAWREPALLWWLPVPLVLGWLAVPLVTADLVSRRLPDVLTFAAYPVLGIAVLPAGWHALAGLVVFGGAHALVRLLAPTAMGGGDVKLAGSLGLVLGALGWADLALAAALAAAATLLFAAALRSRTAPYGPGLLTATWLLATLR